MTSEILICHRCGKEFEVLYSFNDEWQVVSGYCKCALQNKKDLLKELTIKPLDRAIEVLNEIYKPVSNQVSLFS